MDTQAVIVEIQRLAAANGGRPVGERSFCNHTGLKRSHLWAAGFTSYSEAVKAAGFEKNEPTGAFNPELPLSKLVVLVRGIGRFPTKGHIKVARAKDPSFPSYEAFLTVAGGAFSNLPNVVREYCVRNGVADVIPLIPSSSATARSPTSHRPNSVKGYVYLIKHGNHYKIGRSNDTARRRRELSLLLPQELEHVHVIETDDPQGIEAYWHRRFSSRRLRGEWFELSAEDVAAFRRRRYQ